MTTSQRAAPERRLRWPRRPDWLDGSVLWASLLVVGVGFAQYGITAVLGDVATAFGEVPPGASAVGRVGLSATALGIGLAVIRLAGAGSLLAASLADRHGRRRLVLIAVGGGVALTVAGALSPAFWVFVALAALARPLLSGTNTIVGVLVAERASTADRARALALVQASYAVGSGAVAVLRGVLGGLSFRVVLAASAVWLLVLPAAARRVEEPDLYRRAGGARVRLGRLRRSLWRRLALMGMPGIATGLVTGPALTYLFVYGENVRGQSAGFMALLVVVAGPVGLLGLLAGRWLADRSRRVGATLSTTLFTVGAWVTYSGPVPALVGGYLATVLAGAMVGPAVGALMAEVFPTTSRSTATGWIQALGVLGSVTGLALFGILAEVLGDFGTAATVLFLPALPIALVYLRLPRTGDRELDEGPEATRSSEAG